MNNLSLLCADINECTNPRTCGYNQQCLNTLGSYKCECLTGYKPDTRAYVDDNYYHCIGKHYMPWIVGDSFMYVINTLSEEIICYSVIFFNYLQLLLLYDKLIEFCSAYCIKCKIFI